MRELPYSLEELYLEINAYGLWLDKAKKFDPVLGIGTKIFKSHRRLHTCDIIARNCGGNDYYSWYPEHGIHWRRLRHEPQNGEPRSRTGKTKDLWQSRMCCVYNHGLPEVSHTRLVIELEDDEGTFEGKDAREVWLGGATGVHHHHYMPWPWYGDLVRLYPMYQF